VERRIRINIGSSPEKIFKTPPIQMERQDLLEQKRSLKGSGRIQSRRERQRLRNDNTLRRKRPMGIGAFGTLGEGQRTVLFSAWFGKKNESRQFHLK